MADAITPVRAAALPFPMVQPPGRTRRKRSRGIRVGLVASELLSLTALVLILAPLASQIRWSGASRLLTGWSDLRDAHATCQQFVRESESLRNRARMARPQGGAWSWTRLDDGRFRIMGHSDSRTRSGTLRRTRYQCDLVPLTSNGRWRVDSLVVIHERPAEPT
jgi:hypothetical protein